MFEGLNVATESLSDDSSSLLPAFESEIEMLTAINDINRDFNNLDTLSATLAQLSTLSLTISTEGITKSLAYFVATQASPTVLNRLGFPAYESLNDNTLYRPTSKIADIALEGIGEAIKEKMAEWASKVSALLGKLKDKAVRLGKWVWEKVKSFGAILKKSVVATKNYVVAHPFSTALNVAMAIPMFGALGEALLMARIGTRVSAGAITKVAANAASVDSAALGKVTTTLAKLRNSLADVFSFKFTTVSRNIPKIKISSIWKKSKVTAESKALVVAGETQLSWWSKISQACRNGWTSLTNRLGSWWKIIRDNVSQGWTWVTTQLRNLWEIIQAAFSSVWSRIRGMFTTEVATAEEVKLLGGPTSMKALPARPKQEILPPPPKQKLLPPRSVAERKALPARPKQEILPPPPKQKLLPPRKKDDVIYLEDDFVGAIMKGIVI